MNECFLRKKASFARADAHSHAPQLVHSTALLLATYAAPTNKIAMGLFGAGMAMFSGSIYLLVLWPEKFRKLGPVTPIGGVCLIAGWVALAAGRRGVPLGAR